MTIFGLCSLCGQFWHFHNVPLPVAPRGTFSLSDSDSSRMKWTFCCKHTQKRSPQQTNNIAAKRAAHIQFPVAEFTALNLSNYKRQNKVTSQHRQHYLHTRHFRGNCSFESKRAQLFATRSSPKALSAAHGKLAAAALEPATLLRTEASSEWLPHLGSSAKIMLTSCHTRAGSTTLERLRFLWFLRQYNWRSVRRKSKSGPWGRAKGRRRTLLPSALATHIFTRGVNHFYFYVSSPRVVAFCVRLILITAEQNRFFVLYQRRTTSSFSLSPACFSRRPQNARGI